MLNKIYEKYLNWRLGYIKSEIEITQNYLDCIVGTNEVLPLYSFSRKLIDLEKLKSKRNKLTNKLNNISCTSKTI